MKSNSQSKVIWHEHCMPLTISEVAKASAQAMPTTSRVGDPAEDASMKVMRPRLATINSLGLVTTCSQMGKKSSHSWQRAYISGFSDAATADRLSKGLLHLDNVFVMVRSYALYDQPFHAYDAKLPLTIADKRFLFTGVPNERPMMEAITQQPLGHGSIGEHWSNLLPELGLEEDVESMNSIEDVAMDVFVADMTWGRKTWLFDTIIRVLSSCEAEGGLMSSNASRPELLRAASRGWSP
jgi:hypothetical protein